MDLEARSGRPICHPSPANRSPESSRGRSLSNKFIFGDMRGENAHSRSRRCGSVPAPGDARKRRSVSVAVPRSPVTPTPGGPAGGTEVPTREALAPVPAPDALAPLNSP